MYFAIFFDSWCVYVRCRVCVCVWMCARVCIYFSFCYGWIICERSVSNILYMYSWRRWKWTRRRSYSSHSNTATTTTTQTGNSNRKKIPICACLNLNVDEFCTRKTIWTKRLKIPENNAHTQTCAPKIYMFTSAQSRNLNKFQHQIKFMISIWLIIAFKTWFLYINQFNRYEYVWKNSFARNFANFFYVLTSKVEKMWDRHGIFFYWIADIFYTKSIGTRGIMFNK